MSFIAEQFAAWACGILTDQLPDGARQTAQHMLLDVTGLCIAAKNTDYVKAVIDSWEGAGDCTLIGHDKTFDAAGAALVNGTAAHGEDYDDTFEGTPVHAGAVVVPAVLAVCQRYQRSGADLLKGIVTGAELMCRMALVTPTAIHRAGFHPTAVIGAMGATAGVAIALGLSEKQLSQALGIAGSMASGIIEYLAEGTSTKRLHAGWAAQSGIRAVLLAKAGFTGPRTVFEGEHGFFHAFTNADVEPDFAPLRSDDWLMQRIAFKPYACGTMAQPFIDCALKLRRAVVLDNITSMTCNVGEGTVHRLWEPLAEKRQPSTAYSAKFSVPFCIAAGLVAGAAGLQQFTEQYIHDPAILKLAALVDYAIDPENDYPRNYSGHIRVKLADGSEQEFHQAHLRGGMHEPLSNYELMDKFRANCRFAGWSEQQIARCEKNLSLAFEYQAITSWPFN